MSLLNEASFLVTPNGYKEDKLYAAIPTNGDGDMTVTRALATATRVNESGTVTFFSSASFSVDASKTYKFTINTVKESGIDDFDITLRPNAGSSVVETITSTHQSGLLEYYFTSASTQTLVIQFTQRNTIKAIIDNVSVKEVTRDNVPRIDYTDGGCPSILLEPLRTNLLLRSEEFDNAAWTAGNVTATASSGVSPDGTNNAYLINVSVPSAHYLRQTITVTASTAYVFSFWAKRGTITNLTYSIYNMSAGANILSTDYYSQTNSSTWTRINIPFTTPVGCTSIGVYPIRDTPATGTFYLYGAQIEAGAYPTSYIPTTTIALARNADAISKTGISDLIGQTEGVLFLESAALFNSLTQRSISISDGTVNNRLVIFYNSPSNQILVWGVASGVTFPSGISYTVTDETEFAKIAVRYRANDITLWVNGEKRGTDITSQALPLSFNRFGFDSGSGGSNLFAKVKSAQLYKTYLSNDEMAALTTL
jgi:hypothetical protein